ncbi:Rrf2 family transcriptional regulator [Burkholderia cenocepacia]|uniref:helix-turn-helix domain-containing protein n=1 Tax=Burkholderia cenocepacia TaxID=95486 RepID=UPI001AA179F0|nr:Rrf2 family transcriptional regulator [Burkholderia cenocepacia]MBO1856830.1 Rrf2 family transcriptional regulator [Burkholderia cenocepacia]
MTERKDRQSTRRALHAMFVLKGHTLQGLRLKAIAEAIGTSMPNALRDLETLREEGIAERIPGREDCWRLTPQIVQLARATDEEFTRHRLELIAHENRYN